VRNDGLLLCGFNVAIKGLNIALLSLQTSISKTIRQAPAHWTLNCIRKTRNMCYGRWVSVPLPKFWQKLLLHAKFHRIGQSAAELQIKHNFQYGAVRHLEFLIFSYLVTWLPLSNKNLLLCIYVDDLRWRPSAVMNFRGPRTVSF